MRRLAVFALVWMLILTLAACAGQSMEGAAKSEKNSVCSPTAVPQTGSAEAFVQVPTETVLSPAPFSYEEEAAEYNVGSPGVNPNTFMNVDICTIDSEQAATEQAKNECTVPYDTTKVWYDSATEIWKVLFCTSNTVGGDQTVYLNSNGLTCLIDYGE